MAKINRRQAPYYGFVYETTNLINGKKYIGKHKRSFSDPDDIDDSTYLGSGKAILAAIDNYGPENFERRILCECSDEEDLREKEAYYIELYDAVSDRSYYNLVKDANPPNFSGCIQSEEHKRSISKSLTAYHKNHPGKWSGPGNPNYGGKYGSDNPNYGNHPIFSDDTRKRMSESKRGCKSINNGYIEKHVRPEELDYYLGIGFNLGALPKRRSN